jgi:hypothetical protein
VLQRPVTHLCLPAPTYLPVKNATRSSEFSQASWLAQCNGMPNEMPALYQTARKLSNAENIPLDTKKSAASLVQAATNAALYSQLVPGK